MRKQLSIVRLDQPFLASAGQIGFLAHARFDFQVLQPERLAIIVGVL